MRKVILLMHASLDGFVAGLHGEMDWIVFDEELADEVGKLTHTADTALYGRVTYQMMENYWPTAAESAGATRHDIEHANWVNKALKIVFSRTLETTEWSNTQIVNDNLAEVVANMKAQDGGNLLLIGSASIAHVFMQLDLIDEYWINVNPVLLSEGIPLFKNVSTRVNLNLLESRKFNCGVVALHYEVNRNTIK
ncbi:MAG: dihydrofolate reductase family protein [Chitinophagaceae bacterium]